VQRIQFLDLFNGVIYRYGYGSASDLIFAFNDFLTLFAAGILVYMLVGAVGDIRACLGETYNVELKQRTVRVINRAAGDCLE